MNGRLINREKPPNTASQGKGFASAGEQAWTLGERIQPTLFTPLTTDLCFFFIFVNSMKS